MGGGFTTTHVPIYAYIKLFLQKNIVASIDAQKVEIQGGLWGFGKILWKGVPGVVRKPNGCPLFRVLLHLTTKFFNLTSFSLCASLIAY